VVVADMQQDKGEAVAREIGGAFVKCDVSQEKDAAAVVGKAVALGKLVGAFDPGAVRRKATRRRAAGVPASGAH